MNDLRNFGGNIRSHKNQVFTLLLENTFFEKPQRVAEERGGQIDPQSYFRLKLPSKFGENS